jgi:hypothetical protein
MLRIMITKMMMTSTPMMVPIIPLFMARPPLVLLRYPRTQDSKQGSGTANSSPGRLTASSVVCSASPSTFTDK